MSATLDRPSKTCSDRRIVTPEETIVASCLVATASSEIFTRCGSRMFSSMLRYLSPMSRTISPRSLS